MKPQKVSRTKGASILVYGIPGAGKTVLAGTSPNPVIVRPPTDHTDSITDGDVREAVVEDHSDLLEVYQGLQQGDPDWDCDWVWLDGITLMEDHGLDSVFQAAIDRKPSREEFGPDKGEYGVNRSRLTKWIRDMVGLANAGAINLGVTANVMEYWDPVREEDSWAPLYGDLKGALSRKLCGYMNMVGYLQEVRQDGEAVRRVLYTDAPGFVGKDQFNCTPELKSGKHGFVDPTMPDIIAAIEKARGGGRRRPARKKTAARRRKK